MPRVFNREQRRAIEHDPFSISELQRALDRLKKGVMPGVDGLPAEAYQRLTLPVKRRLAARLWDIVTGATPIPPEWANLVHPLYKKADWAQPGNWRPIVCATTEVKLVWTLILDRIAPAVLAHVPASMWGAMAGRSPHEAIFFQDTALDMNPYEMIIASLDVQGAFPHAPHRLLTEVWDAMGLPFLSFMTGYIQTRLYAVITAAGLTPWTGTDSGVPQGGAEGPFLYLLVTLPLAFELARVYPGYAPYPLRSPLINFADDNLLTRPPATATLRTQGYQRPLSKRPPFSNSPQPTWTPTSSWCTPANRSGWPTPGPPPPTSGKANPYTWKTPQSTWESHRPRGTTTSHSQASWKSASPGYPKLPGGTSCLRRAWRTSWKRCSTRPSVTKPCTSRAPKTPYATLDSK